MYVCGQGPATTSSSSSSEAPLLSGSVRSLRQQQEGGRRLQALQQIWGQLEQVRAVFIRRAAYLAVIDREQMETVNPSPAPPPAAAPAAAPAKGKVCQPNSALLPNAHADLLYPNPTIP